MGLRWDGDGAALERAGETAGGRGKEPWGQTPASRNARENERLGSDPSVVNSPGKRRGGVRPHFAGPRTAGDSDSSGSAETDRHLVAVDDHGHGAAPLAKPQHPLEIR